ncbi:MAG: restriction endonuclease subunit R, partial [Nitrospirota bacterium]|nr:restriction endonuclease subunit R [Nitrospirota bacterium]
MNHLHQQIAARVNTWRLEDYSCPEYPALAEILEWAHVPETGHARFLRRPQLRALETYWYLRLIKKTPQVFDLYRKFYPKQSELLSALGLDHGDIKEYVLDEGFDAL